MQTVWWTSFLNLVSHNKSVAYNGRQFISVKLEAFLADRSIHHLPTTPYHPESNGLLECFNGILRSGIQAFIRDGTPWNECLHRLPVNYRERMFDRTLRQPPQVVPSTQHLSVTQSPVIVCFLHVCCAQEQNASGW